MKGTLTRTAYVDAFFGYVLYNATTLLGRDNVAPNASTSTKVPPVPGPRTPFVVAVSLRLDWSDVAWLALSV